MPGTVSVTSYAIAFYPISTLVFRHTFLLAFLHFKRDKTSFFINLIGLSSGLAHARLSYLWENDELSVSKFHEKDNWLYQVISHRVPDGEVITFT